MHLNHGEPGSSRRGNRLTLGLAGVLCGTTLLLTACGGSSNSSGGTVTPPTICTPAADEVQPWLNTAYTPACRAQFLLDSISSVEDKVALALALGTNAGSETDAEGTAAKQLLATYGLSAYTRKDGPAGVADGSGHGTAFPSPVTVAASFDTTLAASYGAAIGQEFHDLGYGMVYGPAMDILRTWHFGRAAEGYGEDPFLAASMARPIVDGMQSQNVVAVIKHFAAYTQEAGRSGEDGKPSFTSTYAYTGNDVIVSRRALHEIYFPPFKAAVQSGGAGGVMASFPKINGEWAAENPYTLGVLKTTWDFDGFAIPDYPSYFHPVQCVSAGMDAKINAAFPIGTQDSLVQALYEGTLSEERVNDMIRRQLMPIWRVGLDANPPTEGGPAVTANRAVAVEAITKGAVLLKNAGVLPMSATQTVAVIGAQAGNDANTATLQARVNTNLYGAAYVRPVNLVTPFTAIQAKAGANATYSSGTLGVGALSTPFEVMSHSWTPAGVLMVDDATGLSLDSSLKLTTDLEGVTPGLTATYYNSPDLSGSVLGTQTEYAINFSDNSGIGIPLPYSGLAGDHQWSVAWSGYLNPQSTGTYRFSLVNSGIVEVYVDGAMVASNRADFGSVDSFALDLTAGTPVQLQVKYSPRQGLDMGLVLPEAFLGLGTKLGTYLSVGFAAPDSAFADAVTAASGADVAVVFVGNREGEGSDRNYLGLRGDQNALVTAVAKANPNTVVVITSGGPVAMPWINEVAAVVQMWFPGENFGTGAAQLLYGDVNPSGKLPMTFPADTTQGPATSRADYPGLNADGTTGTFGLLDKVNYSEDLLVGYRWYDAKSQTPLFPFGHGLSYTTFSYSGIDAKRNSNGSVTVTAKITNSGSRTGAEVAQVYIGFPSSAGEPPKVLKGFQKVSLASGGSSTVSISIPADQLKIFDETTEAWTSVKGTYTVYVGSSSRDIRGTATFKID